ncbi:unnamed protein product [Symbiodinium sp. CCMP2592]|nr:unnamed protein product [Symbiodinium sp. CCMP2592]
MNQVGLYVHGSTIFSNKEPKDLDLLAIVDEAKQVIASGSKEAQFVLGRCEVSVYERDFWLRRLEAMDLTMLTCISTPKRFVLLEIDDPRVRNLTLPLDVLEESVASYAEYTWLKAHRRMDGKGKDQGCGKEHIAAFRILCFGQQLLQKGRITDLTAARATDGHSASAACVAESWLLPLGGQPEVRSDPVGLRCAVGTAWPLAHIVLLARRSESTIFLFCPVVLRRMGRGRSDFRPALQMRAPASAWSSSSSLPRVSVVG